jgi:hypothetical protein
LLHLGVTCRSRKGSILPERSLESLPESCVAISSCVGCFVTTVHSHFHLVPIEYGLYTVFIVGVVSGTAKRRRYSQENFEHAHVLRTSPLSIILLRGMRFICHSAIHKLRTEGLVLRWVTTWESPLLNVLHFARIQFWGRKCEFELK